MDDVVIPISDPCLNELIRPAIRVAQVLDATATELGFTTQDGEGQTELTKALRGQCKAAATATLRSHEVGAGLYRIVHLPLGQGKFLRVVRGY